MTTLEILRAARALIAQPGRWCQGNYATGVVEDLSVRGLASFLTTHAEDATFRFCAVGSCYAVGGEQGRAAERELDATVRGMRLPRVHIAEELNDTTDLPTVLAMFDATIARLEGQDG